MYSIFSFINPALDNVSTIFNETAQFFISNFNPWMVKCLLFYGKMHVIAQSKLDDIYDKYPIVKNYVTKCTYLVKYIHNSTLYLRTEPYEDIWISTSVLVDNYDYETTLYERFDFNNGIIDDVFPIYNADKLQAQVDILTNMFYYLYVNMKTIFIISNEIIETMTVLKYENKYVIYSIFKDTYLFDNFPSLNFPLETSKAKFLSIIYTHPKMAKSISIDLGEEYYTIDNYLLSALFIRRYLEYHHPDYTYIFDQQYKIKIMDNNLKMIELNNEQYVQLYRNTYEIKYISKKDKKTK